MLNIDKQACIAKVKKTLQLLTQQGIKAADVALQSDSGFSVSVRGGDVDSLEHHQGNSLSLTVYKHMRSASVSSSDFSDSALEKLVAKVCAMVDFTEPDPYAGLAEPALLARDYPELELYHHWSITPKAACAMAIECEQLACHLDNKIKCVESVALDSGDVYYVYANTNDFIGDYALSRHSISCALIAEQAHKMERDYEYSTSRLPAELMPIEHLAKSAVHKTVNRLGARKLSTRNCPVIFSAPIARSLLGHFIAAISGGNLYRGNSFLRDQLGESIFPAEIEIVQLPHILHTLGSTPFDSEGVRTEKRHYIENGRLSSYALGSYAARKLGLQSTGNAGGVFNLHISHGTDDLAALLKKMDTGLLVTELLGQGINILTGDYSRGAFGYWVEHGEIQYPVHEITIAGNLKAMFANILAVGNDVDERGNIKAGSILISEMTVAGH